MNAQASSQLPRVLLAAAAVPDVVGGVELWCARTAIHLHESGYRVGIITAEYEPGPPDRAADLLRANYERYGFGDRLRQIPITGLATAARPPAWASVERVSRFFGEQIGRLEADIVFPNEVPLAWDCCAAAARIGVAVRAACLVHTDSEHAYAPVEAHRWLLKEAAGVSTTISNQLSRRLGVPVRTVPYGVETRLAEAVEPRFDPGVRIGFVGRLFNSQKGVLVFADVLMALKARGVVAELWLIGEGPDRHRLRDRLENCGVASQVRWFGAVAPARVPSLLRSIDVLLMPSTYEGMSIAMLESMAQGVVPVVAPVSGIEDVIVSGHNGIVLASRSAAEIADVCARLAENRDWLCEMGDAARRTAVSQYNEEIHRERLVQFIDHVMITAVPSWPVSRFPSGDAIGATHRWLPEPIGTAVRRLSTALPQWA